VGASGASAAAFSPGLAAFLGFGAARSRMRMRDARAGGWRVGRETSAIGPSRRGKSVGRVRERDVCVRREAENIPGRMTRNDVGSVAGVVSADAGVGEPVGTRMADISRRSLVSCATEKFAWLRMRCTDDSDARREAY